MGHSEPQDSIFSSKMYCRFGCNPVVRLCSTTKFEFCSHIHSPWLGIQTTLAYRYRTGLPAYVAWRAGTTTLCQSRLHPGIIPQSRVRIGPLGGTEFMMYVTSSDWWIWSRDMRCCSRTSPEPAGGPWLTCRLLVLSACRTPLGLDSC